MRAGPVAIVLCVWTAASCAPSSDPCVPGNEGCACWANATCNGTLACRSKLCVRLERSDSAAAPKAGPAGHTDAEDSAAGTGASRGPVGGAQAAARPGIQNECSEFGASCSSYADCCGVSCVQGVRADSCRSSSTCASHCCLKVNASLSVCAFADRCASPKEQDCAGAGGDCSVVGCCGGALCYQGICVGPCSTHQDCENGCCAALSSGSACAPRELCSSQPSGASGPAVRPTSGLVPITTCKSLTLIAEQHTQRIQSVRKRVLEPESLQ